MIGHFTRKIAFVASLAASLVVGFSATGRATDTGDVAAAVERLRTAMLAADGVTLRALLDDAVSYGHSSGKVDTKESFVADLDGKPRFQRIDQANEIIAVSGTIAIVRNTFDADVKSPDSKVTQSYVHVLQVWRRDAEGWRLIARQAVPAKRS